MSSLKRGNQQEHERNESKRLKEDGELEGESVNEADDVMQLLGFESFGSTKNTHVIDNSTTAARGGRAPRQARKARQYMNLKRKASNPEAAESTS